MGGADGKVAYIGEWHFVITLSFQEGCFSHIFALQIRKALSDRKGTIVSSLAIQIMALTFVGLHKLQKDSGVRHPTLLFC